MNTLENSSPSKTPDQFSSSCLLASDFDGTQFITDEPAPGGVGVNEAYEAAITKVLGGSDLAVEAYRAHGGHVGRTASEIVRSLLYLCDGELVHKIHELTIQGATREDILEFLDARPRSDITQGLVFIEEEVLRSVTSVFVTAKLEPLTSQIGQEIEEGVYWPRPTYGFLDFAAFLQQTRDEGGQIDTAVISAGHASFISKAYDVYEIEPPDIMITDETVQALSTQISSERRAKPAPMPMALAKRAWLNMHHQPASLLRDPLVSKEVNSRIIYVGDSPDKDGGMAEASHVPFLHINSKDQASSWKELKRQLVVGPLAVRQVVT